MVLGFPYNTVLHLILALGMLVIAILVTGGWQWWMGLYVSGAVVGGTTLTSQRP
jgi:hypothetical protein